MLWESELNIVFCTAARNLALGVLFGYGIGKIRVDKKWFKRYNGTNRQKELK